ncbi:MAG TPA: hypothetical protein VKV40_18725 [Ktedonobacteraceae bacterium]|nr:hypothetical protein [Ktedonobacteraceae bacterium]
MSLQRQEVPPAPTVDMRQILNEFWHWPSVTIARFTLASYVRSGWILGDLIFVWLLYAIFFFEFGGNVAYFFGTAGQGLGALAILSAVVMTQRAMNARVYLPLARITSRSSYVRGLVLATGALRVPAFLLLLALAAGYHHFSPPPCTGIGGCIAGATAASITIGAIGLLANCIVISTLIVTFSAPIATRLARILLLAWVAAVLYSGTSPGPVTAILSVARVPLMPLAACYNLGPGGTTGWSAVLAVVIDIAYIIGLTLLAERWLAKRDLILH